MRFSREEVEAAWAAIRKGGRGAGVDGVSLPDFRAHVDHEIPDLLRELNAGRYIPQPYRLVWVPKENGGVRPISVATVRDRLAQRVLLDRIQPIVERISLPSSFAYRPGIGVRQAVQAVCNARVSGFTEVLEADIANCFDNIDLNLVERLLADLGVETALLDLILQCLAAPGKAAGVRGDTLGLPQGAVLSPTICNLVLTGLDRALARRHRRLVRYADDFVVLCRSARACASAEKEVRNALSDLGLELNPRKTGMADFGQGFQFLGTRFVGTFTIVEKAAPYQGRRDRRKRPRPRKLDFIF
ncbi:MAG: RNA-directed DNA polymerase [Armatimonadetes bacterium]|nr:RNA-directed DNA polymerase [Armatimonadota bacterium]